MTDDLLSIHTCHADCPRTKALRTRIAELEGALADAREALEPFAEVADCYHDSEDDNFEVWVDAGPERIIRASFKLAHCRQAREAAATLDARATLNGETIDG